MAIGVTRTLREIGHKIPHDEAIVGYDDIPAVTYSYPPLTTARQPMHTVGEIAALKLIETWPQRG